MFAAVSCWLGVPRADAQPAPQTLVATPRRVPAGAPVSFVLSPANGATSAVIIFGDGTNGTLAPVPGTQNLTITHAYAVPNPNGYDACILHTAAIAYVGPSACARVIVDYAGAPVVTPAVTPSPAATPTPAPAPTATPRPTPTASPAPSATPTPSPAPTATSRPTATPSPISTATPSPIPTATPPLDPHAVAGPDGYTAPDADADADFGSDGDADVRTHGDAFRQTYAHAETQADAVSDTNSEADDIVRKRVRDRVVSGWLARAFHSVRRHRAGAVRTDRIGDGRPGHRAVVGRRGRRDHDERERRRAFGDTR